MNIFLYKIPKARLLLIILCRYLTEWVHIVVESHTSSEKETKVVGVVILDNDGMLVLKKEPPFDVFMRICFANNMFVLQHEETRRYVMMTKDRVILGPSKVFPENCKFIIDPTTGTPMLIAFTLGIVRLL